VLNADEATVLVADVGYIRRTLVRQKDLADIVVGVHSDEVFCYLLRGGTRSCK